MQISLRLKGHLDPIWQEWLEGLHIEHESDGTSRLSGTLPDQPALYGVLTKIYNAPGKSGLRHLPC